MGAAGPVQEVDVEVDRLAVARQAGRQAPGHAVEVERLVAVPAARPLGRPAGQRRDEHLGFEPGGHDERRLGRLGRQDAALDEEGVRIEREALVSGADLLDDPADPDHADAGDLGLEDHRVVELEVRAGPHADPELERGRVLRPEHQPHGLRDSRWPEPLGILGRRPGRVVGADRRRERPILDHAATAR